MNAVQEESVDEYGPDRVSLDLWVRWWPSAPSSDLAPPGARVVEKNGVSWNLATWDFAPPRWQDRQVALDAALIDAEDRVRRLEEVLGAQGRYSEELWIELRPDEGSAGVVLRPALLKPLIELEVHLMLNAL